MVGVSPGRIWDGWSPSKAAIRTRRPATRRPTKKLGARATTRRGGGLFPAAMPRVDVACCQAWPSRPVGGLRAKAFRDASLFLAGDPPLAGRARRTGGAARPGPDQGGGDQLPPLAAGVLQVLGLSARGVAW